MNKIYNTINPKTKQSVIIRNERPNEQSEVENIVREAFWNVYRPGCLEHYVLHCLRQHPDFVPELNLVMELEGKIIGQVVFCRSKLDLTNGSTLPLLTFGPISIAPGFKRQGYGLILLEHALGLAREMGVGALLIEGNIDFYGRAGFAVAKNRGIIYADDPEADYFLVKELIPGYLQGVHGSYRDPQVYFVDGGEADAFDKQFVPKEKLRLPGQIF